MTVRVCMIGDVYSSAGLNMLKKHLPRFLEEGKIDFCVVNGENATGGNGIIPDDAKEIFSAGADVITGGNHTFERREIFPFFDENLLRFLRPANFPEKNNPLIDALFEEKSSNYKIPGRGKCEIEKNGCRFAVLNLQGRYNMRPIECPFSCADEILREFSEDSGVVVDFHAEDNSEKEAMAFFLDGRVSLLAGTHTHVQTSDQRVLPKGTAYISDLGFTGVEKSIIGSSIESAISRAKSDVSLKLSPAEGACVLSGIVATIDKETKRAISVERIKIREEDTDV